MVAAAQPRRWRLPWGRGRSPWPGEHWALGIRPFCWGLTSGSGPFPAAPHQPFNFQLDLLLSHGNGMQIGLGLPGSGLRPASRSSRLGSYPSNRVASSACSQGVPLSPSNGAAAPFARADHAHCSHTRKKKSGAGSRQGQGPALLGCRSFHVLLPPCHPTARAGCPPWGSPLHPLACSGCGRDGLPSAARVRRGLPGGVAITARQSPAGRAHSATKCCHLPPGPSLASAGGAEGPGGSAAGRAGGGEGTGGAGRTRRVDLGE